MKNKIYIYEDDGYSNFLPLVYLKPVFDLYCGLYTFRERVSKIYGKVPIPISRFDTPVISDGLFINGRAILHKELPGGDGDEVFVADNEVVGFRLQEVRHQITNYKLQNLKPPIKGEFLATLMKKLKPVKVDAQLIKYPWNIISYNKELISKDFKLMGIGQSSNIGVEQSINLIGKPANLYTGKDVKIEPGVFLNTECGPIYIDDGAILRPPSIIDGPCYIGKNSIIDGAKIRPGTTIGKVCRIGGEVDCSIFSDYSNKHHEGFVGHSFVGEWVNLGALTTTSDLKNTYGTIKLQITNCKSKIDTGLIKVGAFIGDHTKTGIGTLLDTGCIIGCFANIYGGGAFEKYIPPFSWGTKDKLVTYELKKALEVAKIVMARRGVNLSKEYVERIKAAFELTEKERR
ncbi:MAG: putative sugar nucleotidyl transferase [bacterium]|nr:putative sugar nucleotidyl transferase [bacterium]